MLILQFVINMLLLNVEMPSESRSLLVQISDLANFDVLSKLDSTTYIFGSYAFNPEIRKPFKPIYQDLYPSMNLIENLGTSFYLTVLCFVAKLVTLYLNLIQKLIKRRIKALDWLKRKLVKLLSWEFFFRLFLQTHFGLLFSSLLNITAIMLT